MNSSSSSSTRRRSSRKKSGRRSRRTLLDEFDQQPEHSLQEYLDRISAKKETVFEVERDKYEQNYWREAQRERDRLYGKASQRERDGRTGGSGGFQVSVGAGKAFGERVWLVGRDEADASSSKRSPEGPHVPNEIGGGAGTAAPATTTTSSFEEKLKKQRAKAEAALADMQSLQLLVERRMKKNLDRLLLNNRERDWGIGAANGGYFQPGFGTAVLAGREGAMTQEEALLLETSASPLATRKDVVDKRTRLGGGSAIVNKLKRYVTRESAGAVATYPRGCETAREDAKMPT